MGFSTESVVIECREEHFLPFLGCTVSEICEEL